MHACSARSVTIAAALATSSILTTIPAWSGPGDGLGGGLAWPTPGGEVDPVTVGTLAAADGAVAGEVVRVAVVLTLGGPEWHINSNQPLEEWLIPTEVVLDEDAPFEGVDVVYPPGHEIELAISDVPMSVYEGVVPIGIAVTVPEAATGSVRVSGTVSYQACNDTNCLRPTDKPFVIDVPIVGDAADISPTNEDLFAGIAFRDAGVDRASETHATTVEPTGTAAGDAPPVVDEGPGLRERLQSTWPTTSETR